MLLFYMSSDGKQLIYIIFKQTTEIGSMTKLQSCRVMYSRRHDPGGTHYQSNKGLSLPAVSARIDNINKLTIPAAQIIVHV